MTVTTLEVHLSADDLRATLVDDARRGLTATPKSLPAKYFYDARGSQLFEQITRLPEYYLTRTEEAILTRHAAEMVAAAGRPDTLVELGSGSSTKTRLLLDALAHTGRLRSYVPVDVSPSALEGALSALAESYPTVVLHGVVADFEAHLDRLPPADGRLVAFLGSTVGNLDPAERHRFFTALRAEIAPDDAFLLGVDLVKDERRLLAAYDDPGGVTAAFNRNVLDVLNSSLGADFRPEEFDHVARWNAEAEWIEMRLRAREDRIVTLPDLDLRIGFAAGEEIRTEISAKFRRAGLAAELASAGFELTGWWTDAAADFAVALAVPR
jgi:L-histidine N-alpha-methyltransferase